MLGEAGAVGAGGGPGPLPDETRMADLPPSLSLRPQCPIHPRSRAPDQVNMEGGIRTRLPYRGSPRIAAGDRSIGRSGSRQPLRQSAVRPGVPDRRDVCEAERNRWRGPASLHRLPLLHVSLPLQLP